MKFSTLWMWVLPVGLLFASCSTTRVVRPLAEKELQVGVSAGGPVVYFKDEEPREIVVPFISVQGAYGISDRLTAYAAWDVTPIFIRTVHTDLGVSYGFVMPEGNGFGLTGGGGFQTFFSFLEGTTKIMPELSLSTYQAINEKWYWYANSTNTFDLGASQSVALNTGFWRPSIGLGIGLDGKRLHQQLELKYLGFNEGNRDAIIGHVGLAGQGQLALYYSINLKALGK